MQAEGKTDEAKGTSYGATADVKDAGINVANAVKR